MNETQPHPTEAPSQPHPMESSPQPHPTEVSFHRPPATRPPTPTCQLSESRWDGLEPGYTCTPFLTSTHPHSHQAMYRRVLSFAVETATAATISHQGGNQ